MPTVREIEKCLFALAPRDGAMDWDNVGLLVGDPEAEVSRLRDATYRSWEWTWGKTPAFTYEKSGQFHGAPFRVAYQAKRGIVSSAVIDCDAIDGALAAQLLNGARLDPEGFAAICRRLAGDGAEELMDWLL